nr:PREDICTED: uncharacterized protein LOC109570920 [Bos indicus]
MVPDQGIIRALLRIFALLEMKFFSKEMGPIRGSAFHQNLTQKAREDVPRFTLTFFQHALRGLKLDTHLLPARAHLLSRAPASSRESVSALWHTPCLLHRPQEQPQPPRASPAPPPADCSLARTPGLSLALHPSPALPRSLLPVIDRQDVGVERGRSECSSRHPRSPAAAAAAARGRDSSQPQSPPQPREQCRQHLENALKHPKRWTMPCHCNWEGGKPDFF